MRDVAVIGGGVSGLATAWRLLQAQPALDLEVLEAGARPGGTIGTRRVGGFSIEIGPNGVLDRDPATIDLARDLGLGDDLVTASAAARRRYLCVDGRLEALPASPPALLTTGTLSWLGRLRLAAEPFIRRRDDGTEESVAAFARRRLGAEAARVLIDAAVTGIFAGDPERLSVAAAFPRLVALEREHGSLVRGALAARKMRAAAGPSGLVSLRGGMGQLIDRLAASLGAERLRHGTGVEAIERLDAASGGAYRLRCAGGHVVEARRVIVATPAFIAAPLLEPLAPAAASSLDAIPYAPVAVVALGYRRDAVAHPLDGFGFLCPDQEDRPALGCLFSSTVYPGLRAPEEHVLLRFLMGGRRHPERADGADDALVAAASAEAEALLGARGAPVVTDVIRWPRGIPQYEIGHRARVAAAEAALATAAPGIVLTGNAYHGVSLNDCAARARQLAERWPAPSAG